MKCVPNIVFSPEHDLSLDLYVPDTLTAEACVLYVHGGGFRKGDRSGAEVAHFAAKLTDAGFAMASMSYRLKGRLEDVRAVEAKSVVSSQERSQKVGLTLADHLFGPEFYVALEDVSTAVAYLKSEAGALGMQSDKVGILGVSAGGIAALSTVFIPRNMEAFITVPDAVVAITAALVQPWRIRADGPPCLLINSPRDRIVGIENARLGLTRAEAIGAPFRLIETGVKGHNAQIDVVLDQTDDQGVAYFERVLDVFEALKAED